MFSYLSILPPVLAYENGKLYKLQQVNDFQIGWKLSYIYIFSKLESFLILI